MLKRPAIDWDKTFATHIIYEELISRRKHHYKSIRKEKDIEQAIHKLINAVTVMHAVRCFGPEGFIFPAAEGIAGWLPWAASPLWESPTVHSQGSSQPVTGGRWGIRAWPPCSKQTLQKAILVSEITKRSAEAFAVQPNSSLFLLPPQAPGVFIERVSLPENFLHPHLHLSAGFLGPDMEQSANMKSWLALVLIREMRIIENKKTKTKVLFCLLDWQYISKTDHIQGWKKDIFVYS